MSQPLARAGWGCLAIVVGLPLGYLLLKGPPADPQAKRDSEIIQDHVAAMRAGVGDPDPVTASEQVAPPPSSFSRANPLALPMPPGWGLEDPFTDQTPFWPEHAFLSQTRTHKESHRTLMRSDLRTESQIFLVAGPANTWLPELEKKLEDQRSHPLRKRWEESQRTSVDGLLFEVREHGLGEGVIGGQEQYFLTAWAQDGDRVLVVDAGGRPGSFDPSIVLKLLQELPVKALLEKVP